MSYMLFIMINLNIIAMFSSHPLSLVISIIGQTLMISLLSGMLFKNMWFSYILFLIILGGMMVLFIYITSIASNEMFKIKKYFKFFFPLIIISSILSLDTWPNLYPNWDSDNFMYSINNNMTLSLFKLYSYPTLWITILSILFLLLTLIIVTYISSIKKGPLRQLN